MNIWFFLGIIVLGLVGAWISRRIIVMKGKDDPITCPVGFECDDVIRGPYSRFLGVSNVHAGLWYYLLTTAFYTLAFFVALPRGVMFWAMLVAGLAFGFSLYLTMVQLFVIKKWCSWCLVSALVNIFLFGLIFSEFSGSYVGFLYDYRDFLNWVVIAASVIGTLVTTLHAFRFIKFLRDFEISKRESFRLNMYSHTAWVAIGFLVLAGAGLIISDVYREFTGNSEFLVLGIITGMLVVYELVHNTLVTPKLIDIHFGEKPELDAHEYSYQRKQAFAFAAVGLVSWYLFMMFWNLSWHEYNPWRLVVLYVFVLIVAVFVSLIVERIMYNKSLKRNQVKGVKEASPDNTV